MKMKLLIKSVIIARLKAWYNVVDAEIKEYIFIKFLSNKENVLTFKN